MNPLLESAPMGQELNRNKMRELRTRLGLTQTEAAAAAGFPGGASQWSDVENGRRANVTLDTLDRIAAALRCDARDLITPKGKGKGKKK